MIGVTGSFLRIYLLAFAGVTSATIRAGVLDRGCIRIDSQSICVSGDPVEINQKGFLEAGFPPFLTPPKTKPLCQVAYIIKEGWADVQFDPDDWCLKGLNKEKVVCCDKKQNYEGGFLLSPYFSKGEGATVSLGSHTTTWEKAFPNTLKSLKDSKSSLNTLPPYNNALVSDSQPLPPTLEGNNMGQTETATDSGQTNAATGSNLDLIDLLALAPVVHPVVPPLVQDNIYEQTPNAGADDMRFLANINAPELAAYLPQGDIVGV